jgi:hypothetical protein
LVTSCKKYRNLQPPTTKVVGGFANKASKSQMYETTSSILWKKLQTVSKMQNNRAIGKKHD